MLENNNICILLTGTIKPINVPDLKRVDPLLREHDYFVSLKKWIKLGYPIVFVENSGFESNKINNLFEENANCEYIHFISKVSHLGKGHGEAEILDFAFATSEILKRNDIIVKSSGRQFIKNTLDLLLDMCKKDVYVIGWLKRQLQYADSRFFIARKGFYINYLLPELKIINEREYLYFEHSLARAIHRCMADGRIWSLPIEYPVCEGISGTDNVKYDSTVFSRFKGNLIIKITNRLLKNDYL